MKRLILVMLAAACGGSTGGNTPDGGSKLDAMVSAPDAAVLGSATVTVMHAGQPVSDATIVASLADGTLLGETTTDSAGHATITVHAGGYLSGFWQDANGAFLAYTFAAVQPGDDLIMKIVDPKPVTTPANVLNVTIQDAVPQADEYDLSDNCGTAQSPTTGTVGINADPSCADAAGAWSLFGEVIHVDNGGARSAVAYTAKKSVAAASTTTLASADWTAAGPYTLTFTDAPANSASLVAAAGLGVNGVDFTSATSGARAIAATQGLTFNGTIPTTAIADSSTATYLLTYTPATGRAMNSLYVDRLVPQPIVGPGPTVDLATTMLPRVHDPGFDNSDLAHIKVMFQVDGSLTGADAVVGVLTWMDSSGKGHIWAMAAPADTTITLPTIPSEVTAWAPTASTTLTVNTILALDLGAAADYDAMRPLISQPSFGLSQTAAGSARVSETCVTGFCLAN